MPEQTDRNPVGTGEERFRLLVDAVTDYAIYMLDPAGRVASWNAGAQRIKGYTADEIVGRHFSQFYTPEDRAADVPATALRTAEVRGKFEVEGWRLRKDGTRFWAHVVMDPIRDGSGALVGFAKITRDLTERRKAAQTLEASQEEFRLLVESVTDYAIYMLDLSGRVTSWNAGAERIKGYSAAEIIGRHFSQFYTEEDRRAGLPETALSTAARDGRFEKEGWRLRKDGTRFWASVVIDPIRGPDGHIRGFAKTTRDITERRQSQKRLDEAREALFQAQKMDALGKLTGGVAHDFNNVLTAVMGSLELVQRRVAGDPRATQLVGNAIRAARRGATLTQRMLAFARRQELKPEVVDIGALVAGMTEMLDRSLGASITIVTRVRAAMGRVMIDPNQLEMAILNLATNARDAMPDGGPLTIEAYEEVLSDGNRLGLPVGPYAVLSVIDEGEGMDAETLARATEPFFTTKAIGKGTGLGLAMVHGLAEQSGGRFVLRSKRGRGTTAGLYLPVYQGADKPAGSPHAAAEEESSGQPLSILAVDDDALVLMNTAAMLEDKGHDVTMAYSGEAALDRLKGEKPFDLMITDQGMPRMTGAQLIERARALRPGLPVILATGYAELPNGVAQGIPRLAKPFLQDQLLHAVASALDR